MDGFSGQVQLIFEQKIIEGVVGHHLPIFWFPLYQHLVGLPHGNGKGKLLLSLLGNG